MKHNSDPVLSFGLVLNICCVFFIKYKMNVIFYSQDSICFPYFSYLCTPKYHSYVEWLIFAQQITAIYLLVIPTLSG